MIKHKYVVLQTSWGIHITIYGEVREYNTDVKWDNILQINDFLWLYCDNVYSIYPNLLGEVELAMIKKMILLLSNHIKQHSKYDKSIIMIRGLQYNYCDYQEEGLAVAIAQWLAKAFKFEIPDIPVKYDHSMNKYIFNFSVLDDFI